jgi:hypothetical protein
MPNSLLVRGLPRTFTDASPGAQPVVFAFCGQCGAALYAHRLNDPTWLSLWLGPVRERDSLNTARFGHCAAAVPRGFSAHQLTAVVPVRQLDTDEEARGEAGTDQAEINTLLDISDLIRWLWFCETGEDLWKDGREFAGVGAGTSFPPQTQS